MNRSVVKKVKGFRTEDGAGVSLVRVLSHKDIEIFDPILMLDSFDSVNPDDYTAGFPMHPHRGIETVSYVYRGRMQHRDSVGNEDSIANGEVQWMTAGSGILHEESLPASERMLGVQLWLNLPAKNKMCKPEYHSIKNSDIKEIDIDGGKLRLLAGRFGEHEGYKGKYLLFDYYDIHIASGSSVELDMDESNSVMIFTLLGNVSVEGEYIEEKTAAKLSNGDKLRIRAEDGKAQVLFMSSKKLEESVVWGGPIVMNTRDELLEAFDELDNSTFLKEKIDY